MRAWTSSRVAWSLCGVSFLVAGVGFVLTALNLSQDVPGSFGGSEGADVPLVIGFMLYAAVGALIAARRPENRIGWVFLGTEQLIALTVKLKLAEQLADRDAAKTKEMLELLQAEAADALEDLGDLARGIYPPLLADQGLPAALEAQARKSPVPVTVEADGIERFPQDIEAAVYFCCLEALQNIAKYAGALRATVILTDGAGELAFQIADDGVGFDAHASGYGTGLQGMADRLAAVEGTLEVRSTPGEGTTIAGRLPVRSTQEAAS